MATAKVPSDDDRAIDCSQLFEVAKPSKLPRRLQMNPRKNAAISKASYPTDRQKLKGQLLVIPFLLKGKTIQNLCTPMPSYELILSNIFMDMAFVVFCG